MFTSLDFALENKTYVVDDLGLYIIGHGNVAFQWGWIVDVFHVPCLSVNLLSVSQLTQTGKIVELCPNNFFIKNLKDKMIVFDGILDPTNCLYKLHDQPQLESGMMNLIAKAEKHSITWHEWLGNLNFRSLKLMVTLNMVTSLPKVLPPDGVWKGCVLSKHHQACFGSGNAWRTSNVLELIHSDIFYINKPSLVGSRYAVIFIDDLSHYTWVYFLKHKSHVFERFKEFRALGEKQCGILLSVWYLTMVENMWVDSLRII